MAGSNVAPVIGISAYCEQARWGVWETQAVVLPRRYVDRVAAAGGIPVLLPPVPDIAEAVGRLDGLMLSGGGDIDPARYGAEPVTEITNVREERDTAELALLTAAMSLQLPVLGICRGMQVINVARGGSLHQHLPGVVGHDGHALTPGSFGQHAVRVPPGSRLSQVLGGVKRAGEGGMGRWAGGGERTISAPTHHHQAVDRLGKGLTATAWAEDGTIEAVETDPGGPFLLAVQWHPEAGDDPSLFRALVAAAREHAAAPA
jgi:gamma-glutamyl-gamma-aminobutyrate hydrolase PuuD